MSAKKKSCTVTTIVSENEKNIFITVARELGTPYNVIMRRLIRYFLDEKVTWAELFRQYNELKPVKTPDKFTKKRMRCTLEPEQYFNFARSVDEWGSTPAVVMQRLMVLYVAGKIERRDIW
jgi:hypothetical protein